MLALKTYLFLTALLVPGLSLAQAYKCSVDGVTRYQVSPCAAAPEAAPLELKTPSPERLAKMQAQEKQRDEYWAGLKKAEAEKQKAENEARAKRQRIAYAQELERERQVINARRDQLWKEHVQDRFDYNCDQLAADGLQGEGCPRIIKK